MADEETKMAEEERAASAEAAAALAPPPPAVPAKPPEPAMPELDTLTKAAPALMAEQMGLFIQKKDLNVRAQVRLRMKALLDLFSVDTGYPPVPALNPDQRRRPRDEFGQGFAPGPAQYAVGRPPDPAAAIIQETIAEGVDAGADVGVVPVPGAETPAPVHPVAPVAAAVPVPPE